MNFFGPAHDAGGVPLPVSTTVLALTPAGVLCGATTITRAGQYGLLACYGDDPSTPATDGARPGETIQFQVDGQTLGTGLWRGPGGLQMAALGMADLWRLYLPVLMRKAERSPAQAPESALAESNPLQRWLPLVGQSGGSSLEALPQDNTSSNHRWLPLVGR